MSALALALKGSRPFRTQQLIHPMTLDPSRGQRIGRPADGGVHAARPAAFVVELMLVLSHLALIEFGACSGNAPPADFRDGLPGTTVHSSRG